MSGERFYEGYDFDRWARALAGPAGAPVYWRPGGGFYEDSSTAGLAGKSHEVGGKCRCCRPMSSRSSRRSRTSPITG